MSLHGGDGCKMTLASADFPGCKPSTASGIFRANGNSRIFSAGDDERDTEAARREEMRCTSARFDGWGTNNIFCVGRSSCFLTDKPKLFGVT
jgi:hypothetical protein